MSAIDRPRTMLESIQDEPFTCEVDRIIDELYIDETGVLSIIAKEQKN